MHFQDKHMVMPLKYAACDSSRNVVSSCYFVHEQLPTTALYSVSLSSLTYLYNTHHVSGLRAFKLAVVHIEDVKAMAQYNANGTAVGCCSFGHHDSIRVKDQEAGGQSSC